MANSSGWSGCTAVTSLGRRSQDCTEATSDCTRGSLASIEAKSENIEGRSAEREREMKES